MPNQRQKQKPKQRQKQNITKKTVHQKKNKQNAYYHKIQKIIKDRNQNSFLPKTSVGKGHVSKLYWVARKILYLGKQNKDKHFRYFWKENQYKNAFRQKTTYYSIRRKSYGYDKGYSDDKTNWIKDIQYESFRFVIMETTEHYYESILANDFI